MSGRIAKGLIGAGSPRGIECYTSPSVPIPVALSSEQFVNTCLGNSSTNR